MTGPHVALHGIGASVGTTTAKAVIVRPAPGVDENEAPCTNPVAEGECARDALAAVSASLKERAKKASEEPTPILKTTARLAVDYGLAKVIDKKLKEGPGVTQAVYATAEEYAEILRGLGSYTAERTTDLYDVRDRAICGLRGLPAPGVPTFEEPVALVARDLAPTETATLDPEMIKGIITEIGGPTSHTTILAAQLGTPAVIKIAGVLEVNEGDLLVLDGGAGEVVVSPTAEKVELLGEYSRRHVLALAGLPSEDVTYDGHWIELLTNIGTVDDAKRATEVDLEGVGLFCTEFLFPDRAETPSLEEQTDTYAKVLEVFGERRVVVHTLDTGADKPLSFASLGEEEDLVLGRRGLRLCQVREGSIDTQLAILAAVHAKTKVELRVMALMVATSEEAEWFAERAHAADLPKVDIMVEVPAAAIRTDQTLSVVDFALIGMNDLTQYTMAADRMDGELASLLNVWQPAVFQIIKFAREGDRATGKPVGVCGGAGGDPLLALVLTGLGATSLSMAPSKVRAVRAGLRMHDLATCQQMAAFAINAPTPEEGRNNVLRFIVPVMQALL